MELTDIVTKIDDRLAKLRAMQKIAMSQANALRTQAIKAVGAIEDLQKLKVELVGDPDDPGGEAVDEPAAGPAADIVDIEDAREGASAE